MTGWSDGFVAVDWGTTNRRAYALDGAGRIVDEAEDALGVLSVPSGGFADAVETLRRQCGGKPLLLAGMIGSNRGWVEAPYVACPAALRDVAAGICWVEPTRTAIVPGLSYVGADRADVMRGEEVQIYGVGALGLVPDRSLICHPGTHTKWITFERGVITAFQTVVTGELFALLKHHSILADLLQGEVAPGDAFLAGVDRGVATGALSAEIFSVRARVLLGQAPAAQAASFVSGLLIGCDLRVGAPGSEPGEMMVVGKPSLTRLYAAALEHRGWRARQIEGGDAFVAGMRAVAEMIS